MTLHEDAVLGTKVTHHEYIAHLVDLAMSVASPRVFQMDIGCLVTTQDSGQAKQDDACFSPTMVVDGQFNGKQV